MNAINSQSAPASRKSPSRQMRRAARFSAGKSMKIRIGGRIMLLVWRTRGQVTKLLHGLLSRSLRDVAVGAATALAVTVFSSRVGAVALTVSPPLPTGSSVKNGTAIISPTTNGPNGLNIKTSDKTIIHWDTFNIASGYTVNFEQPSATSATLNRVIGNIPSSLTGTLTSNGKVWLINSAGIMVGSGATIDVAGFVASTLNVSDADFLANKLNFSGNSGTATTIGAVSNLGSISTPGGGTVYLIGPSVQNNGIINSPSGEVLLGAGSTVNLINTGLPGVSIAITGASGDVTNLGQILSDAGTIGLGGVLVKNSNVLNASSVVNNGGRIFLKATQAVTADLTSTISVDGNVGGKVELNAANDVSVVGTISAIGKTGSAGTVDTTGLNLFVNGATISGSSLTASGLVTFSGANNLNINASVANAAISGGTLQGTGKLTATNLAWSGGTIAGTATDPAYDVTNLTLTGFETLNGRTLNLLAGGVSTAIINTSLTVANGAAFNNAGTLTLIDGVQLGAFDSASTSKSTISNSGVITSSRSANASYGSNFIGDYYGGAISTPFNNVGTLNVQNVSTLTIRDNSPIVNNGVVSIDAGSILATNNSNLTNAVTGNVSGNGTIDLGFSSTFFNNGTVSPGITKGTSTLKISGNYTQGSTGKLVTRIGGATAGQYDKLQISGKAILDGSLTATAINGYAAAPGDPTIILIGSTYDYSSQVSGSFTTITAPAYLSGGYGLSFGAPFSLTYVPGGSVFFNNAGSDFSWSNPANWSNNVTPLSVHDVVIDAGYTVQHASGNDTVNSLTINQNNSLGVSGGSLSVIKTSNVSGKLGTSGSGVLNLNGGLAGTGTLAVDGGSANLKGVSSIANLAMTAGTVTGDSNFTVSNSVAQTGGSLVFNTAAVSLRQTTGDLTVGALSAASATLQSNTGAILQNAAPIINVASLTAQSATGTRLDNAANVIGAFTATNSGSGDVALSTAGSLSLGPISDATGNVTLKSGGALTETGGITTASLSTTSVSGAALNAANAVSRFSATNTSSGDLTLVNTTGPGTLTVGAVTNQGGKVVLDNTGGIVTAGDIAATQGALSVTAHSPITINSSLTARDGITLNALSSALATDIITVNGSLTSTLGSIALTAGTSATVGSTAVVSVSSGNAINLTALAGRVSILQGARFIGAIPTISEVVSIPFNSTFPNTIDSLQKTASPFGSGVFDPGLLAILLANNSGGSRPYLIEPNTIGGSTDNFAGPESGEDKISSDAITAPRALPVCN